MSPLAILGAGLGLGFVLGLPFVVLGMMPRNLVTLVPSRDVGRSSTTLSNELLRWRLVVGGDPLRPH
jgi:hypothetical protein